jgi:hypothetical protein
MTRPGHPLADASFGRTKQFRRPLYDSYCFARLPATVRYLLLGQAEDRGAAIPLEAFGDLPTTYDTVVLLFIDAFGWTFFERFAENYAFLKRFRDHGRAVPLTSQFPSTTAAHVTCIHSGLPVGESGVFEWFYYEPKAGGVIAPLPFSWAGDKARDTLRGTGLTAGDIFPAPTYYGGLSEAGVASYIFQDGRYTPSTYSDYAFRGATRVFAFRTLAEGLINLEEHVRAPSETAKRYYFLYWDGIDGIGHRYGPRSEQFAAEVDAVFTLLEREFYRKIAGKAGKTLVLMTSDHGQIPVNGPSSLFVNRLPDLPHFERFLKRDPRTGQVLKFGGSCRDLFLYVQDSALAEVEEKLTRALEGKAEVWRTNELIDAGLFGSVVGTRLRERVGNLVILPYEHQSVFWHEPDRFDLNFHGYHGGLTPPEMETGAYMLPL